MSSSNTAVDVLLGVAVAIELLCCLGVLVMTNVYDRLHYLGAATAVAPVLILAALIVREGLSSQTLDAIVTVGILFIAGPVLVHATARAARRIDYGRPGAAPKERPK